MCQFSDHATSNFYDVFLKGRCCRQYEEEGLFLPSSTQDSTSTVPRISISLVMYHFDFLLYLPFTSFSPQLVNA